MRPLDNAISVGDRRAEAESSESTTLTGLRRAFDIPLPFRSRFRRDLGLTALAQLGVLGINTDRKSTRLNSSHLVISYAVFCLKKKKNNNYVTTPSIC